MQSDPRSGGNHTGLFSPQAFGGQGQPTNAAFPQTQPVQLQSDSSSGRNHTGFFPQHQPDHMQIDPRSHPPGGNYSAPFSPNADGGQGHPTSVPAQQHPAGPAANDAIMQHGAGNLEQGSPHVPPPGGPAVDVPPPDDPNSSSSQNRVLPINLPLSPEHAELLRREQVDATQEFSNQAQSRVNGQPISHHADVPHHGQHSQDSTKKPGWTGILGGVSKIASNIASAGASAVAAGFSAFVGGGSHQEPESHIVNRTKSNDASVPFVAPQVVQRILVLFDTNFDTVEIWTPARALQAQGQLSVFILDLSRKMYGDPKSNSRPSSCVQAICERSLSFLRAVVLRHGPLAVVPMFAFLEEVCSTIFGVGQESPGGRAKVALRDEFSRVLSLIEPNAEFVSCVTKACSDFSLRDLLFNRAGCLLRDHSRWGQDLANCNFCVLVTMIRSLSENSRLDLVGKLCKFNNNYGYVYDSELLKLIKDRKFSPLLYHNLVIGSVERMKTPITHHIWFNIVMTSIIEVTFVGLAAYTSLPSTDSNRLSATDFMLTLLKTVSKREFLNPMKHHGISEVPHAFMEVFLSKMLPSKSETEASEFSRFLLLVCEHLCHSGDVNADTPLLHMFLRPLCDLKCQSILTRSSSGAWSRSSSGGFEILLTFHAQVSETAPAFFETLKQKSDLVNQVASHMMEIWESAVWKVLQNRMSDLAQTYERNVQGFISILPKTVTRTTTMCFFLQAGIKNLFSLEKFDDRVAVERLGNAWIKIFDSHASGANLFKTSWEDYVRMQNRDSVAISDQSTAFCLRPICETLKEILSHCSQLKNRSGGHHNSRNAEKANNVFTILLAQLFWALVSSEEMNTLVSSLTSAQSHWNKSHILFLFRRVIEPYSAFFGQMRDVGKSVPAHSVFDQKLVSAEADLRRRMSAQNLDVDTSLYSQVCQTWAGMIFNDTLAVRRANMSPPSIVRSLCETLFSMCLQPRLSDISCCAAQFSHAVLTEAANRLVPPHRFAIAAEIATIPTLIEFLKMCNRLLVSDKSRLTPNQQQLVQSADLFTGKIHNLLFEIGDDQITEPELVCLEAPSGRVSSVDMKGFLLLPQQLFPDSDYGIQHADLLTTLRKRFNAWKDDNDRNHQILNFLSQYFGKACIPPDVHPIPPNAPKSVSDSKMLKDLTTLHGSFVGHVNSLRAHERLRAHVSRSTRAQDAYSLVDLVDAGFDAAACRSVGCDLSSLKAAGFDAAACRAAGFDLASLKAAGFDAAACRSAGFDVPSLEAARFTAADIRGCDPPSARSADYDASSLIHSQLKHFCDCTLYSRQFRSELARFRNLNPSIRDNDASICPQISEAVLTYIETLFIQPKTTFEDVIRLVSTADGALTSLNSRMIEKEVSIVESWFTNSGGRGAKVDTGRVKSALKILQYRNNVGEASGALKTLHLISNQAIRSMDEALCGVSDERRPGQTLLHKLHDNSTSLVDAPALLSEIERVFHRMDPSALDIIVHVNEARQALNFLRKQDITEKAFTLMWTNAESRAMGNPHITAVLDKLNACRHFLQPIYKSEMDMARLEAHLSKYKDSSKHRELIDQLNTVAQQWSNVEWYFHSGDNQATLALLGHFQASGRFQSMGRNCPEGPAIRFCFRMGQTATQDQ
jgi:hypothetical protein